MQEKLIICLHSADLNRPSWAVIGADQTIRQSAYQDEPYGLAQIAEDKEVTVIVPASQVAVFTLTLPKMNRSRLKEALPYALEEQLIADVETLHFVPGQYQEDGTLPVCVVAHEKMATWLSQLKTWQIEPDRLISTLFALPYRTSEWQVLVEDLAIVRIDRFQGFVCDAPNLNYMLKSAEAESINKPKQIIVKQYANENLLLTNVGEALLEEVIYPAAQMIADLSLNVKADESINLLSGKYSIKKSRLPQTQKWWRLSAYFAFTSLVLFLFYPLGSYFILASKERSLNADITKIYKQHFPNATSVVAPKMRLEEKLKKITGEASDNRLLTLIGYLSQGVNSQKNIKIKRLDFKPYQLTVEILAATSEDFSQFTDLLSKYELAVKQQQANLIDDKLNAILIIEM